ncbi:hypothetical protein ANN_22332, partial [Periplaneta americana]
KHTRLKVYKTLARPVLTYGSEAWTIRKADEQRLMTAEMRFMRRTAGCSLLEHRKNVDILQELKMDPIVNFVQQYRLQWKKHVERMDRTRWLKQILTYVPRGKRKLGRPRKRWHETITDPKGIKTNATKSVSSPVMNLCEANSHVKVEKLLSAIGWEYLRTCPYSLQDKGKDYIGQQRGFQLVNPTDKWFPGLDKLRDEFASWNWRFGKSPKFSVTRTFQVPQELLANDGLSNQELSIHIDVNKGMVEDVMLTVPPGLKAANGFSGQAEVVTSLKGQRFSEEAITILQKALSELKSPEQTRNEFVVNCMRQVVTSF